MSLSRTAPLAALLAAVALAGCRCPGDAPPAPSGLRPAAGPAPDDDWLEGRLPPSVREGTPVAGGTLNVRIHAEPPHLSPHVMDPLDLLATRITQGRVYDTLMRIDGSDHPRYRLFPGAAESYTESPDHLTFTFRLRAGMRFHDGVKVTAHDLVATLDRILDPAEPTSSVRSYYTDVSGYRALDDLTFQVSLSKPYFLFFRQIAATLPILPRHLMAQGFRASSIHRVPVGSGPWKLSRWVTQQEIVLVRNDAYWGRKPHLERLVFHIVPDHTVATQLFERGEFDLMTQIQHAVWVDMARNPRFVADYHRIRFFPKNYEWVGWNAARPFFADRRVRKAMALLFDRDAFNRTVLHNLERPTSCHFYQESEDCDPALVPLPHDPQGARALLDEAGWKDRDGDGVRDRDGIPFRFTFLMPANSVFLNKLAVVLKEAYRKAGIEMDISKTEWAVFSQRTHDQDFDACAMLWGDTDVESDPYQVWHSSQVRGGSNFVGFKNARADQVIERARVEFDPEARHALYRELGRILYEEQSYLWLNVRPDLDAVKKSVQGLFPSLNFYDFTGVWLDRPSPAARAP